jgi:hypothetical protein
VELFIRPNDNISNKKIAFPEVGYVGDYYNKFYYAQLRTKLFIYPNDIISNKNYLVRILQQILLLTSLDVFIYL